MRDEEKNTAKELSLYLEQSSPPKDVTEIESIIHGGEQEQCSYCGGWFTPRGLSTHEASHVIREHSKMQAEHIPVGE